MRVFFAADGFLNADPGPLLPFSKGFVYGIMKQQSVPLLCAITDAR